MDREASTPTMETFLLGEVDYARCLALQQRLVGELSERTDGQIALLMCEHPPAVTIGRAGSPQQVWRQSGLLRNGQIATHWVNRGGPSLVHAPGQLAVYPIVPLRWHGISVGRYLERLQTATLGALEELGVPGRTLPGRFGIWGRTGQVAAIGISVRNWVTYHGVFLNVSPAMGLMRLVDPDPQTGPVSCLMAERGRPVRMSSARAAIVARLAEALGCPRYHMYTGHPWLTGWQRAAGDR
jgi:lipoyl(octanoyl) transferase